ncbi:family 43 glycosylhydrolase [Actinopolymorpha sp. B17G11]|uniref:family 43 glycosylhydrolase n=1 Tax=Actinopolymorpha sp. B17G11 TaxID=3160861 RepID=UPI0032E382F4
MHTRLRRLLLAVFAVFALVATGTTPLVAAQAVDAQAVDAPGVDAQGANTQGRFTNPLMSNFADAFSDPGVIRGKDGYWYAFATATVMTHENQDAGGPPYYMPIGRTADLVNWEYVGTVFSEENHPTWKPFPGTGYWAPDVRYVDGRYYLYYSLAGGGNAAIGLATAPTPAGPWTDSGGPVVDFVPDGEIMEIDPALFVDTDGTKYLYYGSFRRGGMHVVRLSADGTRAVGESTQVVAGDRGEAPWVVKRDGYYYLFYSAYGCCAVDTGGYPVFAGRSMSPTGPFVDAEGVSLTATAPGGTIVNSPNGNSLVGTGHNAVAVDRSGQDWYFSNANSRFDAWGGRPTVMDRLDWIAGWPTVRAGAWTSDIPLPAPAGTWDVGGTFADGSLRGWRQSPEEAWRLDEDADSGAFASARSRGPQPVLLRSKEAGAADYRAEADLRVRGDGAVGLVVGYQNAGTHATAWLDPDRRALVVDVVVDGETVQAATRPLHDGFAFDAWHAVTAEVRGTRATFEVSAAMEGSPLARLHLDLPDELAGQAPVGVVSRGGGGQADNVGTTTLYEPVTEKVPDPEVGTPLPEYGDEFDGTTLGQGWTWEGAPSGDLADGAYVWDTQDADFSQDDHASVLLREAPEGTYTVETKLTLPLGTGPRGYERAGLVAWIDRVDSVHVAPTSTGATRQAFLWVGPDASPWPDAVQLGPSADTLWLRLRHTTHPGTGEHLFQAATSRDGTHWNWGAIWPLPGDAAPPRIGLVSMGGEGATARFDHVRVYGP